MKIFNRKFPHYRQNNACDCGPTCLRMITRHYRHEYSAEMLRRECHTSRGGVNMLDISEAAAHIGFEVEELLHGRLPFVTRHGITVVIAVIAACLGLVVCMVDIPVSDILRGLFSFRL